MKWFPAWFNDIGFIITSVGFLFTIIQIMIIKSRQKAIHDATIKTTDRINNMEHLSFISKCETMISDMKQMVVKDSYLELDKALPDIKKALNTCQSICIDNKNKSKIINALRNLGINQNNINKVLSNKNNDFEKDIFLSNLDEIKDIFSTSIEICKYGNSRNSKG